SPGTEQTNGCPAGNPFGPWGVGGQLSQDRVERAPGDAVAVRRFTVPEPNPAAVARPEVDAVVHRAALLEQRCEAELLDRGRRAGLNVVRADGLVGIQRRPALDQCDVRAAPGKPPCR